MLWHSNSLKNVIQILTIIYGPKNLNCNSQ
jgi:hypothetical protein